AAMAAVSAVSSSTPTTASRGCVAAKAVIVRAASSGCKKSSVNVLPGVSACSAWGWSEPTTTVTCNRRAASRKAAARYVVVVIRSKRRGIRRQLAFGRLVIGVGAGGMISDIDNLTDLRKRLTDRLLNPLIQGDSDHATALAAATKPYVDDVIVH